MADALDFVGLEKAGSKSLKKKASAEEEFIDQKTRELMVLWADLAVRAIGRVERGTTENNCFRSRVEFSTEETARLHNVAPTRAYAPDTTHQVYFEHAIAKGWISKDGKRVLAAGYATAARYLKR